MTVFAVVLTTGIVLIELLTLRQQTVPDTCRYRLGQLRLRALWPLCLTMWSMTTYALPRVAVWALHDIGRSAALVGALLGTWVAVRVWRLTRGRHLRHFVYDAAEPSATTTIDLPLSVFDSQR